MADAEVCRRGDIDMWRFSSSGSAIYSGVCGYLLGVLSGVSQLINAILGGNNLETFSARAYRNQDSMFWDVVRKMLDAIFSPRTGEHCRDSFICNAKAAKDLVK